MPLEELPQRHVITARHGRDQTVVIHHSSIAATAEKVHAAR